MGTKNVSTQTNAFAPAGMGAYNALMPQMQGVLSNMMQNPMQAGYLNMLLQQGIKGAQQQGGVQQQNLMQNMAAGGFGGQNLNAFLQGQLGKIGRSTSGAKAGAYMNTLLQAPQLQMAAAQQAGGFRPLQTGSQTVQQQSGLGTWLPTLLGAGLNFATGGGMGLLGGLLGGASQLGFGGQAGYGGLNSLSSGPGFGSIGNTLNIGGNWQMPGINNSYGVMGSSGMPGGVPPAPIGAI